MSNPHLTQQPILSQREAPANVTRNDSHEILLNHRLEQTRRELIRVLDDDEAAEQRRAHTNPLTIHRRRRRTLMSRNNIAPNILLLGWSILTSLSTPHILRISRAVSKPCTIRKPLFPIALRHLDGISALQLPAASQPYSLDETLDIQKTTTRCSMTPPMHCPGGVAVRGLRGGGGDKRGGPSRVPYVHLNARSALSIQCIEIFNVLAHIMNNNKHHNFAVIASRRFSHGQTGQPVILVNVLAYAMKINK
ncbi:hypothetical protein ACLKA6_000563 [Drosophila palustris]